jgi:hypothetical protein
MVRRLETHVGPKPSGVETESKVGDALANIPYEPFLPVESKLVAWSLIVGLSILGALVWLSQRFFSG